ncbi:MAG TPA: NAD(P)H-hydrate dehydratase [Solirubrobacteraceae bacterium]|nr:NAD(P)H-hydrate dehydratase [Solirubrobacteraceae bacterium]
MERLPDWLEPLPDAETMRGVDRWAIEDQGVAGLDLMERAGTGVARAVEVHACDGLVAVVCGKGNNGGDGLVVARLLREAAREVTVVCVAPAEEFKGDAAANLARLPGEAPVALAQGAPAIERASVIVDALLGTGFAGEPHGAVAEAIALVNAASGAVVAVDVPSGVDASSGVVSGEAVHADVTVTFHAGKPGLWIMPGKRHAGEVRTIDIGVPRGAPMEPRIGLMTSAVAELLPRRADDSTKFASGQVVVAGGSRGLTGAPRMAAHAAMRAGAGYVIACVPASAQDSLVSAATPELMTRGVAESDGAFEPAAAAQTIENIRPGGALALGPGIGRSDGAVAFARELALRAQAPMVLDADGLNAHAGRLAELRGRHAPTVLTPHAGELARLLELDSEQIERERLGHVRAAAEQSGAVVVLKGDDSLIADPSGYVAVSRGGSPALATAGTGDVLTGVVAALLAQGLDPFEAASAAVWLHAAAGREAARRHGAPEGVIASDVIEALPAVRGEVML